MSSRKDSPDSSDSSEDGMNPMSLDRKLKTWTDHRLEELDRDLEGKNKETAEYIRDKILNLSSV